MIGIVIMYRTEQNENKATTCGSLLRARTNGHPNHGLRIVCDSLFTNRIKMYRLLDSGLVQQNYIFLVRVQAT